MGSSTPEQTSGSPADSHSQQERAAAEGDLGDVDSAGSLEADDWGSDRGSDSYSNNDSAGWGSDEGAQEELEYAEHQQQEASFPSADADIPGRAAYYIRRSHQPVCPGSRLTVISVIAMCC